MAGGRQCVFLDSSPWTVRVAKDVCLWPFLDRWIVGSAIASLQQVAQTRAGPWTCGPANLTKPFFLRGSFDKIVCLWFFRVLFDKTVFLRGYLTNSFFYGCYLTKPFFLQGYLTISCFFGGYFTNHVSEGLFDKIVFLHGLFDKFVVLGGFSDSVAASALSSFQRVAAQQVHAILQIKLPLCKFFALCTQSSKRTTNEISHRTDKFPQLGFADYSSSQRRSEAGASTPGWGRGEGEWEGGRRGGRRG